MSTKIEKPCFEILGMIYSDFHYVDSFLLSAYIDLLRGSIKNRISKDANFSAERFFWARFFHDRKKRLGYVDRSKSDTLSSLTTQAILLALTELKKNFPNTLSIIDVGSGPFSIFSIDNLIKRSDLEIVTVDPLADFYKNLHERFQTKYVLNCVEGYGEKLNELFKKEQFHLAVTENALDHSNNPKLFVKRLVEVVKPGGYLIIAGYFSNGSKEKWQGLHKWNIEVINKELVLSNQSNTIRENILSGLNVSLISQVVDKDTDKSEFGAYCFVYCKDSNVD